MTIIVLDIFGLYKRIIATMTTEVQNGKLKQTTQVNQISFTGVGANQKIVASAQLNKQYVPFFTLYQTYSQIYTHFPGRADELVKTYGWDIYDTMMMDAMVSGCINDIVNGVVNDHPRAVPARDTESARFLAQWVNRNFMYMQVSGGVNAFDLFRQILKQSLVYGHCVAELVFEDVDLDERYLFLLRKIVPVFPFRYSFRLSSNGDVIGIVPFRYDATTARGVFTLGEQVIKDVAVVPSAKLLHLVWDRRGMLPDGQSALASAFRPWSQKQQIYEHMEILAKRIRKSWLGVLPPDARKICVTDPQTGEEQVVDPTQDLLDVLRALANGEGGVVPAGTTVESFDVEVAAAANYFIEAFKAYNREILRAIYSRMLANNNDAAASTTGEFDRDMTSKLVKSTRRWFESSLFQLAYSLCFFSFGAPELEDVPHIIVGRGNGMPLSISEIATLHQSGWFTRKQKAALDDEMGLPSDDGGELIGVNSAPQEDDDGGHDSGDDTDGNAEERDGEIQGRSEENLS